MTITSVPLDTIQHYIIPNLEPKEIIHFISSTKYFYCTFTKCNQDCDVSKKHVEKGPASSGSNYEHVDTNRLLGLSFADKFWKILCMKRWKSVSFDHIHQSIRDLSSLSPSSSSSSTTTTTTTTTRTNCKTALSQWFLQYKKRHILDMEAKSKILLIIQLKIEGKQQQGRKLMHLGDNDRVTAEKFTRDQATLFSSLILNGKEIWDFMIGLTRETCQKKKQLQSCQTVLNTDNNANDIKFSVVTTLLEAMHRLQISEEFQQLSALEQELFSQRTDKDKGSSDAEVQRKQSKMTMEYGSILIAKYYQSAMEIVSDYDIMYKDESMNFDGKIGKCDKALTLEDHINDQIDGMANFIQNRLSERYRSEQTSTNSSSKGDKGKDGQWPMDWILEEMKELFQAENVEITNENDNLSHYVSDNDLTSQDCIELTSLSVATKGVIDTRPFVGNVMDYYSHHNSLIHKVIQTRKGIPLTLAVLYGAIVKRLSNVDMEAIGLPGHFVLSTEISLSSTDIRHTSQHQFRPERVFVDVFHGGVMMTKQQCQHLICSRYGIAWDESYVRKLRYTEVWCRMLRNLLNCHNTMVTNIPESRLDSSYLLTMKYNTKMMKAVYFLITFGFENKLKFDSYQNDDGLQEILMLLCGAPLV